jgi:hypothetical protein
MRRAGVRRRGLWALGSRCGCVHLVGGHFVRSRRRATGLGVHFPGEGGARRGAQVQVGDQVPVVLLVRVKSPWSCPSCTIPTSARSTHRRQWPQCVRTAGDVTQTCRRPAQDGMTSGCMAATICRSPAVTHGDQQPGRSFRAGGACRRPRGLHSDGRPPAGLALRGGRRSPRQPDCRGPLERPHARKSSLLIDVDSPSARGS